MGGDRVEAMGGDGVNKMGMGWDRKQGLSEDHVCLSQFDLGVLLHVLFVCSDALPTPPILIE